MTFEPTARQLDVSDRVLTALLAMAHGDDAGGALAFDGRYTQEEVKIFLSLALNLTVEFGIELLGRNGFIATMSARRAILAELAADAVDLLEGRTDLVVTLDGKQMMTPRGIALMLGFTEAEVDAEYHRQTALGDTFEMPPHWRRRSNELMAQHGTNDRFKLLRIAIAQQERDRGDR